MNVIDKIESSNHTHFLLINENTDIINKIELQFIKNGLEKNELCLYATTDVDIVVDEMKKFGIDVIKYKEKDLLLIIEIPKNFEEYKKLILAKIDEFAKLPKQIRLVSTHNFDFLNKENAEFMTNIEQYVDDNFSKIHGSMICSFFIKSNYGPRYEEFITDLLNSHHGIIFLKKDGTEKIFKLP